MRLNAFTDYGFRVLMRLAGSPDKSFSSLDLSQEFGISRHHLTKVIATMAKAGFVTTRRGHGGGIQLAKPADTITLGEVVRVMEKCSALVECFRADGGNCTLSESCRLSSRLEMARLIFLKELDRSTIADCAYIPPAAIPTAGNDKESESHH